MHVRTYRAKSLKEALQMVQHELGPEARVVQTREVETGWWDRFAHGRQFEIRTRRPGPQPLPLRRRGAEVDDVVTATSVVEKGLPVARPDHCVQDDSSQGSTVTGGLALGMGVATSSPIPSTDAALWLEALTSLIDAEVPELSAREFIDDVRQAYQGPASDLDQIAEALISYLANSVRTCSPIRPAIHQRQTVALVGPTGVGKTTTIAKLAANLRLREHRKVGLITVDTYRVAAVEQLRTYAEIMDLPMEVAATPREMSAALSRLADQDLVLIDTSGHSPRDAVHLQQLRSMLAEAQPDETHLVVSAVSATPHLHKIVHSFSPLGATSVVVTKLDEATGLGNLLPMLRTCQLPVSYLTCGQTVPDDIVVAEQDSLLKVLVGRQPIAALI